MTRPNPSGRCEACSESSPAVALVTRHGSSLWLCRRKECRSGAAWVRLLGARAERRGKGQGLLFTEMERRGTRR